MMNAPITVPPSEKRPPASDVPPITTARMASISRNSPVLFGSAAVASDVIIRPARPANTAHTMYTVHVIDRGRHAGEPGRLRVAADRLEEHSERGPAREQGGRAARMTPARMIENGTASQ